jgi:hypothetical protein
MRALLGACLLFIATGATQGAYAAEPLRPFTARYTITWSGMSAGGTSLSLEHLPDGRWAYESRSQAKGLFRLAMPADLASRSVFRINAGRIVPEIFTADDGASSDEKDQKLTFDWARGRVGGTAERKSVDLPLQPGTLDTMSVQVALMNDLLSGRTPERFTLVDTDQIKDYLYTREGAESVKTNVGQHETVIFSSRRPGSKKATYFWCAPELGYVPVKVERRNGKEVEWFMTLKEVDIKR